ncbi:FecR family protein [Acanthopleuribacter pedis]|uniref:FecR domain-containing protein n=1 Tax=Acanthopleuribacter pedis TaxID=442870 RepID=A0A8J7QIW8_9BACT|nr:FecR domain-containing protein [Acanthopleuribacter pedis]MBO1323220.1 FecR domain-containing protein [Acanthopleuribacter pedis]
MPSFFDWLEDSSRADVEKGHSEHRDHVMNPATEGVVAKEQIQSAYAGDDEEVSVIPEGPFESDDLFAMRDVWQAARSVEPPPPVDTDRALMAMRAKIRRTEEGSRRLPAVPRLFWAFLLGGALLVTLGLLVTNVPRGGAGGLPVIATEIAATQSATLPDGSVVTLNADSRLEPLPGFGHDHRRVVLHGEASFDVVKGEFPFEVVADQVKIAVVGTVFNVYARSGLAEVVVQEGVVDVTADGSKVQLTAGTMTTSVNGAAPMPPKSVRFPNYPGWQSEQLIVDGAKLGRVVAEIERRHGIPIKLEAESLAELEVTGLFVDKNPTELIHAICTLLERECRREEGGFVIY